MTEPTDQSCSSLVEDYDEAKRIAEKLNQHYPGHLWAVNVNQGVAFIKNLMLSGSHGFVIKLKDIDSNYRAVVKAGGEVLERFNISRGRLQEQEILNIDRDHALRPIGDFSR